MDKIFIHALKSEAIIGIIEWERQVRQTILIDLEMSADIPKAARSDAIDDTLNYKSVAKRVVTFVEGSSFHLVETLAQEVAMLVLGDCGCDWVQVKVSKPGAVRHSRDVGILIERTADDLKAWRARR